MNISEILTAMSNKAAEALEENVPGAQILDILKSRQKSMEELQEALASGDIDEEELKEELEREKLVIETEMITQQIAAKAAIQKAINEAMDVFYKAVKTAL